MSVFKFPDEELSAGGFRLKVKESGTVFHLADGSLEELSSNWNEERSLLTVVLPDENKIVIVPHEDGMIILDAALLRKNA